MRYYWHRGTYRKRFLARGGEGNAQGDFPGLCGGPDPRAEVARCYPPETMQTKNAEGEAKPEPSLTGRLRDVGKGLSPPAAPQAAGPVCFSAGLSGVTMFHGEISLKGFCWQGPPRTAGKCFPATLLHLAAAAAAGGVVRGYTSQPRSAANVRQNALWQNTVVFQPAPLITADR